MKPQGKPGATSNAWAISKNGRGDRNPSRKLPKYLKALVSHSSPALVRHGRVPRKGTTAHVRHSERHPQAGHILLPKIIRLGADTPFRICFSLKTTSRRRAGLLAPALTLICERVAINMMSKMAGDGLNAAQRAEIFRRQILVERDRLEAMHASLHVLPPEDHDDIGKALTLRLGASEMAAQDGVMQGKIENFLVARVDPDNDDQDIVVLAWSDLAASFMSIKKELTGSGRQFTYVSGRNKATGHADLAWATMHALHFEPIDGPANEGAGQSLMEMYE